MGSPPWTPRHPGSPLAGGPGRGWPDYVENSVEKSPHAYGERRFGVLVTRSRLAYNRVGRPPGASALCPPA